MKALKNLPIVLLLNLSLLFISCISTPKNIDLQVQKDLGKVFVTNTKSIYLLSPDFLSKPVDKLFLMTFESDSFKFSTPIYVYADKSGIYLTILNNFGIDMGSLNFSDGQIELDSSIFPDKIKPVYLINEFQNAFYQQAALSQNLKNSSLDLQILEEENCQKRIIKSSKKLVEEIEISSSSVVITNHIRAYKITLLESEVNKIWQM